MDTSTMQLQHFEPEIEMRVAKRTASDMEEGHRLVDVRYPGMYLQTTMMVAIVYYDTSVDVDLLYKYARTVSLRVGVIVPEQHAVGTFISLSANGYVRGQIKDLLVRRYCGAYLRNCLSLYVRTSPTKSVNCKISAKKIHVCGVLTKEEASDACRLVMGNILELESLLSYIRKIPENIRQNTLSITGAFKGPKMSTYRKQLVTVTILEEDCYSSVVESRKSIRDALCVLHKTRERKEAVPATITWCGTGIVKCVTVDVARIRWLQRQSNVETKRQVPARVDKNEDGTARYVTGPSLHSPARQDGDDHLAPTLTTVMTLMYEDFDKNTVHVAHRLLPLPFTPTFSVHGDFDRPLWALMARIHSDHKTFSGWYDACQYILRVTPLFSVPPALTEIRSAMTNCRATLPYGIHKSPLARAFEANGYAVIYNRLKHDHVSVFVPYVSTKDIIRKRKLDAVQFMVFGSGKITITGPDVEINIKAFATFMLTIRDNESRFRVTHEHCLKALPAKRTKAKANKLE
jgi:hypothetical protein